MSFQIGSLTRDEKSASDLGTRKALTGSDILLRFLFWKEEELDRIRSSYERLAEQARGELKRRKPAKAKPEKAE